MQCLHKFKKIKEKGIKCERGLVDQGILKHHKDNGLTNNSRIEKLKFGLEIRM